MSYNALAKMREVNKTRFGMDVGPFEPVLTRATASGNDLKSAALRFIHDKCEDLLFDTQKEKQEDIIKAYLGSSLRPNQIPFNMEKDIDRLCFERALETFFNSGVAEDAYSVYYCYLKMFFGRYGKSKKMVELLSEYESNGSSLLMKHRDHYSHSVYVFALGLAIYETNEIYRNTFMEFYHLSEKEAPNVFLEYWGMTALFHDIGYPFELPFEQVLSYFEVNNKERGEDSIYLAYNSVNMLTDLTGEETVHFEDIYGWKFVSTSEVFAYDINKKLGKAYDFDYEYILGVINDKPSKPERFGYFMDHAFFSSARLYREMVDVLGIDSITEMHVDALSAILLHNSMFKFQISYYKDKDLEKRKAPLKAGSHPLAWLLMICDELQCWDRTAYGRNSRTELHPMYADFDFSNNSIFAIYNYDEAELDKIKDFEQTYDLWVSEGKPGKAPRLKAYSDMELELSEADRKEQDKFIKEFTDWKRKGCTGRTPVNPVEYEKYSQDFSDDIRKIVDLTGIKLTIIPNTEAVDRKNKHTYLSSSNFLHLFDFAVALHGRRMPEDTTTSALEDKFENLSLEYQLSGINRAKNFGKYLDAIHCFYSDKPVDYEMVAEFTPKDAETFAPMEHERWVREHQAMGWKYGTEYLETKMFDSLGLTEKEIDNLKSTLREQTRLHKLTMDGVLTEEDILVHYKNLPESEQDKDWKPFNSMLRLLKKFDGIRIYKLY